MDCQGGKEGCKDSQSSVESFCGKDSHSTVQSFCGTDSPEDFEKQTKVCSFIMII